VGIDPGKHKLALACLDIYGKDIPETAILENWTWKTLRPLLREWFIPGSHLVVEAQYVAMNPAVALELARVRGYVEGVAEAVGYKVAPGVAPTKWQAHFKIGGRRPQRKEQAQGMAAGILLSLTPEAKQSRGLFIADSDEADAVCIAAWLKDGITSGQV
jgi:Holliday junction resolvasome RuvABC endonuclease subunit